MSRPTRGSPAADAERFWEYTRHHEAGMVEELQRFVSAESGSGDGAGIEVVGALLAQALEQLGFVSQRVEPDAQHVIARRTGAGAGRLLVLIHLDTVWPRGTLERFPFRLEGERAHGPGVADMKGGWVVLLWALRALAETGTDAVPKLEIFMTADEELGSRSARPHIERSAHDADWAFVMEPARESGALVTSRGAVGALELETRGRTAHSITGPTGASAIQAMARKIIDLEALTNRTAGLVVNVGIVRGGSARQVVPEDAWASIDLRAPTSDLAGQALEHIRAIAGRTEVGGIVADLTGGLTRPAFQRSEGNWKLFLMAKACGRGLGLELEGEATGAGSDGNFTAALGVPTLDGLGAHGFNVCSKDEYVLVPSLPQRAALLAALIANLPTPDAPAKT